MSTQELQCQHCEETFEWVNGNYRGGGVTPKFCSKKCRWGAYYILRKDAVLAKNAETRSANPEKAILARVKSRANREDIPFDISVEDIVIPSECPILGIPLHSYSTTGGRKRGYSPDAASLDRIYPTKGYIKGNVRVISARANLLKNDATVEELRKVLEDLERIQV